MAEQLERFFEKYLSQYPQSQKQLELEELLIQWHQAKSPEPSQVKHDRVGVFWALLLLSSQSKVELSQEEFYQDLTIQFLESP
ncbi:hypothetical protein AsFPU3_3369 [Aphanothece sacrum FPU3]|nr:hypothetical protein AsFPU3_3369 [Aphanothece sacrum FPU3]